MTVARTESQAPEKASSRKAAQPRRLAGFAGARDAQGFTIHIIDDAGEVFEISASRENLELMVANLQQLIESGRAEDALNKAK